MATKLDLADAQFIGYNHAKRGYSLIALIESMGLTKIDWENLKLIYSQSLNDNEVVEIDEYFK